MSDYKKAEPTLLDTALKYLSTLLRYKWMIIIITGVAAIGATAFCVLSLKLPPEKSPLPNTYAAEAVLILQQNTGTDIGTSIMTAMGLDLRGSPATSYDTGDLILQILQSRWLLDSLIEQYDVVSRYHITGNVRGKSRELVLAKMRSVYTRNTGAITISYEDIDPVYTRDMVNGMVMLLDTWFNQNSGTAKRQQMKMLEEKITEVKNDIQNLEGRLKNLQKKYGVLTAQDLGASQATSLADLRSQLILRDIEIKNYSSFSKIDDPRLEQLKEERQNIQDLINQIQQRLPEYQLSGESDASASPPDTAPKSLPDVAQEFTQLTLELDIQRRIYNTLSPQYEAAKLGSESESVFQVLEMAEIPDTKSGPQRSKIVIYAVMAGLLGSIALAFVLDLIKKVKNDPEKVKLLSQR